MEPNDLNPTPRGDDPRLDDWLRANATLPALPDDGFTRRVLTALPAPPQSRLASRRLALALGAVAGIGYAAVRVASGAPAEFKLPPIGPEATAALAQLADPKLHVALVVTAVTLAFVFWGDLRRRVGL